MDRRLIVRPSVPEDIIPIAEDISELDRNDLREFGSALLNLGYGLHYSDICYTIATRDGRPLGMFGAVPWGDQQASMWMISTNELVTTYRVQLAREGRKWADWVLTKYPVLTNFVPIGHKHRWLTWVGFKDVGTFVYNNQKFRKMERRK